MNNDTLQTTIKTKQFFQESQFNCPQQSKPVRKRNGPRSEMVSTSKFCRFSLASLEDTAWIIFNAIHTIVSKDKHLCIANDIVDGFACKATNRHCRRLASLQLVTVVELGIFLRLATFLVLRQNFISEALTLMHTFL